MPTNHGIYRKEVDNALHRTPKGPEHFGVFRHGIHQIFDAVTIPPFAPNGDEQKRAVRLKFHYEHAIDRFVFSLQRLNTLMQEMVDELNRQPHSVGE